VVAIAAVAVGDLTMIPTMLAMLLRFDRYAGLRRMTVLR
jgi:hypothetical protein